MAVGRRARLAVAIFAAVSAVSLFSVAARRQLGVFAGLTDEYFALGAKLRVNHTLGPSRADPSALRPPGYPFFIAAVLQAYGGDVRRVSPAAFEERGMLAVGLAQCGLLALTAAVF